MDVQLNLWKLLHEVPDHHQFLPVIRLVREVSYLGAKWRYHHSCAILFFEACVDMIFKVSK
jgi:hypothetical protein